MVTLFKYLEAFFTTRRSQSEGSGGLGGRGGGVGER